MHVGNELESCFTDKIEKLATLPSKDWIRKNSKSILEKHSKLICMNYKFQHQKQLNQYY